MLRAAYISPELSDEEYSTLIDVLKHYSILPVKIHKIRSAYKITTEKGIYCLKKLGHGKNKADKTMKMIEHLRKNGFNQTADFLKTIDDKECIRYKKDTYYMTSFIDGKEYSIDDDGFIEGAANFLARFHKASRGFYFKGLDKESRKNDWVSRLNSQLTELSLFKEIIEKKKIKTPFDHDYLKSIENYIPQLKRAINLLSLSNYQVLHKTAIEKRYVCHDSFYYQNIINFNNDMHLIDFDSVIYEVQAYDIAKFIRRILYNSKYSWDFNVCRLMIDEYNKVFPLNKEELEIILAFLMVPHKFWKMGRKRYIKGKEWSEGKYLKKINKYYSYIKLKDDFFNEYVKCYGIEIE